MKAVIIATLALLNTNFLRASEYISPQSYGAVGDGMHDDTNAIQRAIKAAVIHNVPIFLSAGQYLISKTARMESTPLGSIPYGLRVVGRSHFSLNFIGPGQLITDIDDRKTHNVLLIDRCSNFRVLGLTVTGHGSPKHLLLYTDYAVLAIKCTNFDIVGIDAQNTAGACLAVNCTSGMIQNSYSGNWFTGLRGMHFGTIGCSNMTISHCASYGGSGDGDIFHFGSGENNTIESCSAFNHPPHSSSSSARWAQGIGLDSGQRNSHIKNCYAQGYYYGIDVKTNCVNCTVIHNSTADNVIGIAARRGEGNDATADLTITGNTILIPTAVENTTRFRQPDQPYGMLIQDSACYTVEGNRIIYSATDFKPPTHPILIQGTDYGRFKSHAEDSCSVLKNNEILQLKPTDDVRDTP